METSLATFTPTGVSHVQKNPLPKGADQLPQPAKDAAKQFEAYYVQQFMELTQPPADKDSMFYGGFGEEMFRHTMNEQMAKGIADQGGFGLANQILGQMVQKQAAAAYAKTAATAKAQVAAGMADDAATAAAAATKH